MTKTDQGSSVTSELTKAAEEVLDDAQLVVGVAEEQIEQVVAPVRKSILKRFPVLFLLAVTFGVTATITGMEQMLVQSAWFSERPEVMFGFGIGVLVLTGTLYKKLG
jgi:hypothetical protein